MSRNLLENNQFPKPKETFQSIHVSFMWNYSYLKPNVHVSCAIPLLIWMETYHFSSSAFMVLYTIETSFFCSHMKDQDYGRQTVSTCYYGNHVIRCT